MNRRISTKFRLYVAGDSPNSIQAVANLTAFCLIHLANRHQIEVIDVLQNPKRALADGIFMTPMLMKISPSPVRRIVGTLGKSQLLLLALGVESTAA